MSKPKGRRKPLHSEITSLRPAPDTAGPDSFVESDAPPSAEHVGADAHNLVEEALVEEALVEEALVEEALVEEELIDEVTSRSDASGEVASTSFAPGAEDPTGSGESEGDAQATESSVARTPVAPQATSFDEGDRDASSNDGAEDASSDATSEERASLLDALGLDALGDGGEPSNLVSMVSDADETEAFLSGLLEALLFTSQRPLALKEIARAAGIDRPRARELLERLSESYAQRGVCIEEVAGGYAMRSSPRYAPHIQKFLALRPVRLSRAQLETLAIVAYRQPVTKPEVDDIRGVDSGQVLKGLLERSLLKMVGKKDEPGRPTLYGTTSDFLELLNLRSLGELPTLREYTELSEESRRKFAEETGEAPPEDAAAFQSALADSNGADVADIKAAAEVASAAADAGESPTQSHLESDASAFGEDAAQAEPEGARSEELSSYAAAGEPGEELAPSELTDHTEVEESEMSVRMPAPGTDTDPAPVHHQEIAMGKDEDEDVEDKDEEDEDDDDDDDLDDDDDDDDEDAEGEAEGDDEDDDDDDDDDEDDEDEDVEEDEED